MPKHWCLVLQYGERLPIGKESVINGVPASVVKGFYERWYRPEVRNGSLLRHLAACLQIALLGPNIGEFSHPDEAVAAWWHLFSF